MAIDKDGIANLMHMDWSTYGWLIGVVVLASACQNLTGFAFGLIFVGLAGALQLMPIADAANVAGLLSLVNGVVYLRNHPFEPRWDLLKPILISSSIGVLGGLALLNWLSGDQVRVLRMLLGVTIIACAVVLLLQKQQRAMMSGPVANWVAGLLSGVLGGLFSTSGPPMVYHLYRQPLSMVLVRQCLIVMFLAGTVLRLAIVIPAGELSLSSLMTAAVAVPVVAGVTWMLVKFPPPLSTRVLQWMVCSLLLVAGVSMLLA